jgi:hypothetical protein
MVASLSPVGYFMPIVSFLFVFVLIYALLQKTKVLGGEKFVSLMISFFLSTFFIYNASLVEWVQNGSAWVIAFFVCLFLIILLVSFTHGKVDVIINKGMAWAILALVIIVFVISSSYAFNWAINWSTLKVWAHTDWFGFVLLLIMAAVVSKVLVGKK